MNSFNSVDLSIKGTNNDIYIDRIANSDLNVSSIITNEENKVNESIISIQNSEVV